MRLPNIKASQSLLVIIIAGLVLAAIISGVWITRDTAGKLNSQNNDKSINGFAINENTPRSIPIEEILNGGPGRDGIPAIDNPKFTTINDAKDIPNDTLGIFVELNGTKKYYPYNILVWHEIVNDHIADTPAAITFCPLCGSAVVFDRRVEGTVVRFGVSGLLHESNLLMYDDKSETLWSQSRGEGVVGLHTGIKLTRLPTQLLQFRDIKEIHPDTLVLSTDTGQNRDYSINPYGDYDSSQVLLFDVSVQDTRLPVKTVMYVIPIAEKSLAFDQSKLARSSTVSAKFFGREVNVHKNGNGEIFVTVDGWVQPGYFEMWFSWATQHQKDGELWIINE